MSRLAHLAAIPLLLVLAACSGLPDEEEMPPAGVGEVITAQLSSQIEGHHTYVVLPGRRYDFTVSSPREEIDSVSAGEAGVSVKAAKDRRFVEIAWELNVPLGDTFIMQPPPDVAPMLTLTAGGERYPVGALNEEGVHAAIVVVPEETHDIGLEIEYDGLVQVIADAYDPVTTRADGPNLLYLDAPTQRWESCPETLLEGGDPAVAFFGVTCQVNISSRVPYFGPLGWAPAGRAWVVVRFLAGSPLGGYDLPSDYVEYTVGPSEVQVRVDGAAAPELFPLEEGEQAGAQEDGSWKALAVFSTDDSGSDPQVSFQRVLIATPDDPDEARAAGAPERIRRVHSGEL